MRRLFFLGLLLCTELVGCGALVTLPPEPGPQQVQPSASDADTRTATEAGLDGGLDVGEVDAALDVSPEAADDAAIDGETAPPPSTCPATRPNPADPCALPESGVLRCYYGDAASGSCIDLAYCDGHRWGRGLVGLPDASGCD